MYVYIVLILILLTLCYVLLYSFALYWKRKGVPTINGSSLKQTWDIFCFRTPIWKVAEDIYNRYDEKYVGSFLLANPTLFVKDLDLIRKILVKDFQYFPDRSIGRNPTDDYLGANILFNSRGSSWKLMRSKVIYAYSTSRINLQIPLMEEVAEEMCKYLAVRESQSVNAKEICAQYSTDVITTSAYGIRGRSFTDEKDNFRTITAKIFEASLSRAFAFNMHYVAPSLLRVLGLTFLDKSVNERLVATYKEQMILKLKTGTNRNDFLDFIIQLCRKESDSRFTIDHRAMMSQAAQYFIAGFETIGSSFCYMLYELARNEDYQTRLRTEIESVMSHYDSVNTDALTEMVYLDMVFRETLRMYPVLPFLDRKVARDYTIPDTDVTIEKGTNIYISTIAMHMDPKYFPDPHKFDPSRFSEENKGNIIPFTYLPIGAGPRICIGARYGFTTIKVGIVHVLRNFKVSFCAETPEKLKYVSSFVLVPSTPINLAFSKI